MIDHTCYARSPSNDVSYWGHHVTDKALHINHLKGPVRDRLYDEPELSKFESDLSALANTKMSAITLKKLLAITRPRRQAWEIGEAWAEVDLLEQQNVVLPWNMERDKRTPKASLQGADLVGLKILDDDDCVFAFGEVKTSKCKKSPPSVMTGQSGMIFQLETLNSNWAIRLQLMQWLATRCRNTDLWSYYQKAAKNFLNSRGKKYFLFGYLMRDTLHNELDISNRADTLATVIKEPTIVKLFTWYFPHGVDDWYELMVN